MEVIILGERMQPWYINLDTEVRQFVQKKKIKYLKERDCSLCSLSIISLSTQFR